MSLNSFNWMENEVFEFTEFSIRIRLQHFRTHFLFFLVLFLAANFNSHSILGIYAAFFNWIVLWKFCQIADFKWNLMLVICGMLCIWMIVSCKCYTAQCAVDTESRQSVDKLKCRHFRTVFITFRNDFLWNVYTLFENDFFLLVFISL